jgi:hypothetical protein
MPAQMIELKERSYALLPKGEYQDLVAQAHGLTLPSLPEPDPDGSRPAIETIEAIMIRGLVVDRLLAGLTRQELAERAGVDHGVIDRCEDDHLIPGDEDIERLDQTLSPLVTGSC